MMTVSVYVRISVTFTMLFASFAVKGQRQTIKPIDLADTFTPWSATWTPDDSFLVYTDWTITKDDGINAEWQWDIFSVKADGSKVRNLTNNPAQDFQPVCSPGGERICFTSDRDDGLDLFILNLETLSIKNITNTDREEFGPSWSPDGTMIAYSQRSGDIVDIYILNLDNGSVFNLTDNGAENYDPFWHPDGSRIAFSSNMDGPFQIYEIDVGGAALKRLTYTYNNERTPAYAKDGKHIAFSSDRDGLGPKRDGWKYNQLYRMNLESGSLEPIFFDGVGGSAQLKWSYDGQKVVFTTWRDAHRCIYTANADMSEPQRITTLVQSDFYELALKVSVSQAISSYKDAIQQQQAKRYFTDAELRNLISILIEQDRLNEAYELAEFYKNRDPDNELAQDFLLLVSKELWLDVPPYPFEIEQRLTANFRDGVKAFRTMKNRYPTWYLLGPDRFLKLSYRLNMEKKFGDQLILLELAHEKHPDNTALLNALADTLLEFGSMNESKKYYRRVLELRPEDEHAKKSLAKIP